MLPLECEGSVNEGHFALDGCSRAGTEWAEDEDRGLGAVDVAADDDGRGRVHLPCGAGITPSWMSRPAMSMMMRLSVSWLST